MFDAHVQAFESTAHHPLSRTRQPLPESVANEDVAVTVHGCRLSKRPAIADGHVETVEPLRVSTNSPITSATRSTASGESTSKIWTATSEPGGEEPHERDSRKVGSSNLPWEARWWEDGRQRKRRFRTEKAGHKALLDANIRDERRKLGMPADPGPITYAELVQRYLDQYDRRSKRWLEEMLSYSLAGFGDIRVRSLASDRIALWLTRLRVGSKTKRHALNAARQVLAMGVEWGIWPSIQRVPEP